METLLGQSAMDIRELIDRLNTENREVIFLGDGVPVYKEQIETLCKVPYSFAPAHANRQRAGAVAALGEILYKEGRFVNADDHKPEYLRPSQAERERNEQLAEEKRHTGINSDSTAKGTFL
jgi:tRNA A37 threonylcarbamoyladenosine modification protein TsaB